MRKNYLLLGVVLTTAMTAQAQAPINQDSSRKTTTLQDVIVRESRRKVKNDTLSATLKMDMSLLNIPQNITSVSSTLLADQGAFVLKDVARNASGVYFGLNNNVFDGSSNLYMRGLPQNGIFRNGLSVGTYQSSQDDEAVIDRVEVIKGPAGFLSGAGEAGGRINVVTKTPRADKVLNATLTAGSYNFYRAAIDVGSAVKEKGFSYRLNAAYNYQEYSVRIMKSNK